MDKFEWKKYLYYGIIGIISFIVLVFFPMIGSTSDVHFQVPSTVQGWTIYIVVKVLIVALNLLIFHCFMQQAKLNVRDNEDYKKANEILKLSKTRDIIPQSPKKWTHKQYSTKGITLVLTTGISTVALTNALLTYDYMSLLTYGIVITMALIFGVIQMKTAEAYWTNEFYQYALLVEQQEKEKEEQQQNECDKSSIEQRLDNNQDKQSIDIKSFVKSTKNDVKISKEELSKCLQSMTSNIETYKSK